MLEEKKANIKELMDIEKNLFLVCNPEFKLLPKYIKEKFVIKGLLPDLFACRDKNAVIVAKEEVSKSFFMQYFSIPFLFSYMDLYILPFGKNKFYYCNHHLDLFRVYICNK